MLKLKTDLRAGDGGTNRSSNQAGPSPQILLEYHIIFCDMNLKKKETDENF